MDGQRHASTALTPGKRTGNHGTRGCVGPGNGVDWCGKSRPTAIRSPDRQARKESVYRLTHFGPCCSWNAVELYSGDAWLASQTNHWLSCLKCFRVFFIPLRQIPG
jgi:hypothetical protein